jgi:hypothetical protein
MAWEDPAMTGRPPKKQVNITLDRDDYLWARLQGFNFSQQFGAFLKMVRCEAEVASYGLIIRRAPVTNADHKNGQGGD